VRVAQQLSSPRSRTLHRRRILGMETPAVRPGLDQRAVHRKVVGAEQVRRARLLDHRLQQALRHLALHQTASILGIDRGVPHLVVQVQADKPAEQNVVIQLLHQLRFAPDRIQNLQQQRAHQPLRRNRPSSAPRIERLEVQRQFAQSHVGHGADAPQRMVLRHALLGGNIAEDHVLLLVISWHGIYIPPSPVEMTHLVWCNPIFSASCEAVPYPKPSGNALDQRLPKVFPLSPRSV
jgi:hypothetical protein